MSDAEGADALIEAPPVPPSAPLALYRRYRPDTFAEMIGQEHVTEPLQRALTNNRVNHAYLFSGPRGCGKTTSARILARALNCERAPVPEPCGQCDSCRDLARGAAGSIDVIEIDAASHGGVDDARDLRERAFFSPVNSRYKIYIVDEAHMVSTAGFNAMLKLVEEPPPHVKFIFATTEPDKVIGTIRSRTHHYPFRLVPPKILGAYLAKLCQAEGIAVENAVLPLVVRAGAGSVRDSLSVLDQLLGGASEQGVGYRQATSLLGFTPDSLLDEVLDAFAAGDAAGVFSAVDKVIEVGQDPRRFAEDLLGRLRDLVIVQAVPNALTSGLVSVADDQGERLQAQAAALGAGELARAAEVVAAGLTEMRGTTAPRLHLELMCARVLLPGADVDDRGIHARLDRLERRIGMSAGGAAPAVTPVPTSVSPVPAAAPTPAEPVAPPATEPTPGPPATPPASDPGPADQDWASPTGAEPRTPAADENGAAEPDPAGESGQPAPAAAETAPAAAQAAETAQVAEPEPAAGSLSTADLRRLWPEVLDEVKSRRRFTWILLSQNAQVTGVHDGVLSLGLANAGARDSFARGGSEDVLRDAIVTVLGVSLRIEALVDPTTPGEPGRAPAPSRPEPPASSPPAGAAPANTPDRAAPAAPAGASTDPWAPREPAAAPPEGLRPATSSAGSERGHLRAVPPEPTEAGPRSSQARDQIRSTRLQVVREQAETETGDDATQGADRDDRELDDANADHEELLTRHLGAELIGEETTDER